MEKYIPAVLIGGVVLYLIWKMSNNEPATQIINRAIPVATTSSVIDTRDPARVQAFGNLASLAGIQIQAKNQLALADKSLTAETNRLASTSQLENARLEAQQSMYSQGLQANLESTRLANAQRTYDINQQYAAQNRALDILDRNSALAGGLAGGNLLAQILGQLFGKPQQTPQRPSGLPSGSATGSAPNRPVIRYPKIPRPNIGVYNPPFNPGYYTPQEYSNPFGSNDYGSSPVGVGSYPALNPNYYSPDQYGLSPYDYEYYGIFGALPIYTPEVNALGSNTTGNDNYYGADYLPTDDWQW